MVTWHYWLGLVVIFLVSYRLFSGAPQPSPVFWAFFTPVVFFAFFAFFLWLLQRGRRDCVEGSALLNQGRFEEALTLLTRAVAKSPRVAGFEYTRAKCLLQLLRLEEAEAAFLSAQKLRQPKDVREFYAASAELVRALQGKQALAAGVAESPERVLTRAIEFARKGDWQAAREQLGHPSQEMLWGTTRVLKEALSAWCHEKTDGKRRPVDLTLLRRPGVADVRTFWPELAEQLSSHAPSA